MIEQQARRIIDSAKTATDVIAVLDSFPNAQEVVLKLAEHMVKQAWMQKCSKVLCYKFPQTSTKLLSSSQMVQYVNEKGIRLQAKILQLIGKQNLDSTSIGNLFTVLIQLMKIFPERLRQLIMADPHKFSQDLLTKISLPPTPDFIVSFLNLNRVELHTVKVYFLNDLLSYLQSSETQHPKLMHHLLQQIVQDIKAAQAETRLSPYKQVFLKLDLVSRKEEWLRLGLLEVVLQTALKSQILVYPDSKYFIARILNNQYAIEQSLKSLIFLVHFLNSSERQNALLWALKASLHTRNTKLHLYTQRIFQSFKSTQDLEVAVFEQLLKTDLPNQICPSLQGLLILISKKIGINALQIKQIIQASRQRESAFKKSENFGKMERVRGRVIGE